MDQSYLSIFTITELKYGIELLEQGNKRQYFEKALAQTLNSYAKHIINPDVQLADVYAKMAAKQKQAGTIKPIFDLWIAATAKARKLTLVTRNTRDFRDLDVKVINPFLAD